ncbi:hypothetical protein [Ruegeria sediminis]|uniref:hypothetical protein n=1 Tax=Ruegeria sediminis TaxID=2583820 RepID=UPI001C5588D0|nr:hypothetical protein [Ruegeria sediminis]
MTTADWAIIISMASLAVSIAGFVWNIWSKFIYPKPKVRVGMSNKIAIGDGWEPAPRCISLSAVNHGPGEITIHSAIARPRWKWYRRKGRTYAMLNPLTNWPYNETTDGPFSGGLPKTLRVGETFDAHFIRSRRWFDRGDLIRFGFTDSFGRNHWAPMKHSKSVRAEIESDETLERFNSEA